MGETRILPAYVGAKPPSAFRDGKCCDDYFIVRCS